MSEDAPARQVPPIAGLSLSPGEGARGMWFHDGDPVVHQRLGLLLHRSVARDGDGQLMVTTGIDRLPFVSLDCPLFVRELWFEQERARALLRLAGEEVLALGSAPVWMETDGRLRIAVDLGVRGRFWARLSRTATQTALAHVGEEGPAGAHLPHVEPKLRDDALPLLAGSEVVGQLLQAGATELSQVPATSVPGATLLESLERPAR